jgi:K+ transporter
VSARRRGLRIEEHTTSYFVEWHLVRTLTRRRRNARLSLFAWMQRRSAQAAEFFRMPAAGVIVLATEIELRLLWTLFTTCGGQTADRCL